MKKRNKLGLLISVILIIGLFIPQDMSMPVQGAGSSDYNHESFWHYPWGKSITHKGVDIFAREGTPIHSSTNGLVLFSGENSLGGKFVLIIGPKWRLHYYAHLNEITTHNFAFVSKSTDIGTVGTSGNAAGKAPHLHYSILTPIPYVWRIDGDKQGWKKMFYLNPIEYFKK